VVGKIRNAKDSQLSASGSITDVVTMQEGTSYGVLASMVDIETGNILLVLDESMLKA